MTEGGGGREDDVKMARVGRGVDVRRRGGEEGRRSRSQIRVVAPGDYMKKEQLKVSGFSNKQS